jgi:predicted amidohydrolase
MSGQGKVTVTATQFACGPDRQANIDKAERMVRRAAAAGANIVLLGSATDSRRGTTDDLTARL